MTVLPRPTQAIPLPATDSTVTAGLPEAGLSTRLDPSTAISQGVIGGRKFGARVMNWILGGFGDWLAYLESARADLNSRTATLEVTRINSSIPASVSAMQAFTDAPAPGKEVYVAGIGFFSYQNATTTGFAPWIYPATGIGHGSWVLDSANTLLETTSDQTINPLLVSQSLQDFGAVTPVAITYTNSTSSPTVIASASVPVIGGSTLRVAVSGVTAAASSTSIVDVLLTFNDTGTTTHTAGQIGIPTGATITVGLGYDFTIPADATTCTVDLRGTGGAMTASAFASAQWLQWSVLKISS